MSLHSTTRADGRPSGVAVASTIALGFGWWRSLQACASQSGARVERLGGQRLGQQLGVLGHGDANGRGFGSAAHPDLRPATAADRKAGPAAHLSLLP